MVEVVSGVAVGVAGGRLWEGIDASRTIVSLFKVKLSQFYKIIIIINFTSVRAKLISLSIYL